MKRSNQCTVALVVGLLAAFSAQAGSGSIKVTHSDTPYKGKYQTVPANVAKTQATVHSTKASEVQVAVMAHSTRPAARQSVYIHR